MEKILLVFGTRPEAIKMVPIVEELQNRKIAVKVCVTAQHRQMLDQVLELFAIKPDYDLDIMQDNQNLYTVTSNILLKMQDVLYKERPDMVLVHGDTTTTFAVSLASFYQKIAVGHIEAGLRTHNLYAPWPEEANRKLTAVLAQYHFAPTLKAKSNLLQEGVNEKNIIVTGNTVIDALLMVVKRIENDKALQANLQKEIEKKGYRFNNKKIVLITGHRRENFGKGFLHICNAIAELARTYRDVDFVYPVHLNPNVQKPVFEILSGIENIYLIEPLEYLPFVYLMGESYLILTDSGGIQEEAPSLGKPVLVMRESTERPEALQAGTVRLVGTDEQKIIQEVSSLIEDKKKYERMAKAINPYGDGKASKKIADFLEQLE